MEEVNLDDQPSANESAQAESAEVVAPNENQGNEEATAVQEKEIPTATEQPIEAIHELPQQEPKWYIIQTLTGQEERVKGRIEDCIKENNLGSRIFRVLIPEEETVEIKGNKRIEKKKKMYPGYVFIEASLDNDLWYILRSTAGVARFIGGKAYPQAVTDREMQRVLKQLGIKEKEVMVEFAIGDPIRVISGSFRGYSGSVSEVNAPKSKLKALINIFGRDTSVEVDFDRIEKII